MLIGVLQSGIDEQAKQLTGGLNCHTPRSCVYIVPSMMKAANFKPFAFKVNICLCIIDKKQFTYMEHLHAHEFEAFHLKPLDDVSNDAPLHAIGLDGKKGALLQLGHDSETKKK